MSPNWLDSAEGFKKLRRTLKVECSVVLCRAVQVGGKCRRGQSFTYKYDSFANRQLSTQQTHLQYENNNRKSREIVAIMYAITHTHSHTHIRTHTAYLYKTLNARLIDATLAQGPLIRFSARVAAGTHTHTCIHSHTHAHT